MKFEPGKTYHCRMPGDADCIIAVTVASRTAGTLTATNGQAFRISRTSFGEMIRPLGKYAKCPLIWAE